MVIQYRVSLKRITEANSSLSLTKLSSNQPVIIPNNKIDRNGSRSRSIRIASRSLSIGNNEKGIYSGISESGLIYS